MENASQISNVMCPVCSSKEGVDRFSIQGYVLRRCGVCGVDFVTNPPASTEDIYGGEYFFGGNEHGGYVDYDTEKRVMRKTLFRYLDDIESLVSKGTLLDVGAATGYFLSLARDRGWNVVGVEMSDSAAERGREKGIVMHVGTLEKAPVTPGSCDAVTMIDVIEHTTDPRSLVRAGHEVLRTGGVLFINTPDSGSVYARMMGKRWHLLCPPEHLVFFDRKNLAHLLDEEGFDVKVVTSIGKTFTVQYIVNTLARWLSLGIFRTLSRYIEGTWVGSLSFPINLRDNMVIIAVKR